MDLLLPHSGTVIWMLIAFSIVLIILKKFAWKPILNALKAREESIEEALLTAERTKKEMKKIQAENEKILAEARLERDKILKDARVLKDDIINEAKKKAVEESNKIIDGARDAIKAERNAAVKEIREQIASFSVSIAEKILQEKLEETNEQKELIDKYLREINVN
jgi:F-type H+-transporting ATPase subunit b